jgi:hypothetical protein
VWDALLHAMPLIALVRNLGKMSAVGLVKLFSQAAGALLNLLPVRRLTREQEGLDEFSFAAHDHSGKPLEPFSAGNLRLFGQPVS